MKTFRCFFPCALLHTFVLLQLVTIIQYVSLVYIHSYVFCTQLIFFKSTLITKGINGAEPEYMNILPSLCSTYQITIVYQNLFFLVHFLMLCFYFDTILIYMKLSNVILRIGKGSNFQVLF